MNLLFVGPPGAGKGTQAKRFAQNGAVHLATGDILRQEKELKTPAGLLYEQLCSTGGFAPDRLVAGIITMRLDSLLNAGPWGGYILDGFPRNIEQARIFDDFTTRDKKLTLDHVIAFQLSDAESIARMTRRWQCTCGQTYGKLHRAPDNHRCTHCSRALYQRPEDSATAAPVRIAKYHEQTAPLLAHYKTILYNADASKEPDQVYADIRAYIQSKTTKVYTRTRSR